MLENDVLPIMEKNIYLLIISLKWYQSLLFGLSNQPVEPIHWSQPSNSTLKLANLTPMTDWGNSLP